ncbi:MAG: hypothetical protein C3F07_00545 [Anaerolineales bacterium]|nr:hypothetical protein [Anaerolineae bacterium]PWB77836.1 MAG: hypothetical protein C3F07_00545 [Anaerolineales bacterium]
MRRLFLTLNVLAVLLSPGLTNRASAHTDETRPAEVEPVPVKPAVSPALSVNLSAPTGRTITFNEQNEEQKPVAAPHKREIPHLVLYRNGVPTPGFERALTISIGNLAVPGTGMYVNLSIETQHGDPNLERTNNVKIKVWEETKYVPFNALTQQGVAVNFNVIFDPVTRLTHKTTKTPTDYYRYRIIVSDPIGNQIQTHTEDYAFLMENQWRVPLPTVLESAPGAAPDELLVYYYDMTPFQTNLKDPFTRIPREDVDRYIQTELIPAMVAAIRVQSDLWEFPWYEEWRNYRLDEEPKTLSVALGEYNIWFHGQSPSLGYSMISIRVDGSVGEYETMTDGLMSIFHHELFHNHQRNISLHYAGHAAIAGRDQAWMMFSEGTAVLASSVGQPDVQFTQTTTPRSYLKRAHAFIGSEDAIGGGLNKSYERIPYQTAAYWRFLYEKCGGMQDGTEDPAAGMKVIRTTLETLYRSKVVDITASTDLIGALPHIMDLALADTATCPFHTYKDSLSQFGQAIYALRLENGRCPSNNKQCGFHDPDGLYTNPPIEKVLITNNPATSINGNIPTSYGIDLVELEIDPGSNGKTIKIVFDQPTSSIAEYTLSVWMLKSPDPTNSARGLARIDESDVLNVENGYLVIDAKPMNTEEYNRIGLIIIRMDPFEIQDSTGNYTVQVLVK